MILNWFQWYYFLNKDEKKKKKKSEWKERKTEWEAKKTREKSKEEKTKFKIAVNENKANTFFLFCVFSQGELFITPIGPMQIQIQMKDLIFLN